MSHRSTSQRGFTLIEIGVVIAVMAMLAGLAVPALRNVTGAEARTAVNKLASNIRAARGAAAVSGQTCRMAFDLDNESYLVECADGLQQVSQERSRRGARDDSDDEKEVDPEDLERMSEKDRYRYELRRRVRYAAAAKLEPQPLTGGLELKQIWTSHQEDAYEKGISYLYFFPSGLAEAAAVQLQSGDDAYTLLVSPLGGRVRLVKDHVDYPKLDEED